MNATQLKAVIKRNGLNISKERTSGICRQVSLSTEGIRFEWVDQGQGTVQSSTPTHSIVTLTQVLKLVSVARDSVFSTADQDKARDRAAQENATILQATLSGAGVAFKRERLEFTIPDITRKLEEGWGKRSDNGRGPRYRSYKRVIKEA